MLARDFTPALNVTDLPLGTSTVVTVGNRSILIVNHGDEFFAIENRCSHADQQLDCGRVRYGWIACPAHGAKFDLATGAALTLPATDPIATF